MNDEHTIGVHNADRICIRIRIGDTVTVIETGEGLQVRAHKLCISAWKPIIRDNTADGGAGASRETPKTK